MQHPIKKGPENGRFQCSHGDKRYLLADRKVQKGDQGGRFQVKNGKKRYLLQ